MSKEIIFDSKDFEGFHEQYHILASAFWIDKITVEPWVQLAAKGYLFEATIHEMAPLLGGQKFRHYSKCMLDGITDLLGCTLPQAFLKELTGERNPDRKAQIFEALLKTPYLWNVEGTVSGNAINAVYRTPKHSNGYALLIGGFEIQDSEYLKTTRVPSYSPVSTYTTKDLRIFLEKLANVRMGEVTYTASRSNHNDAIGTTKRLLQLVKIDGSWRSVTNKTQDAFEKHLNTDDNVQIDRNANSLITIPKQFESKHIGDVWVSSSNSVYTLVAKNEKCALVRQDWFASERAPYVPVKYKFNRFEMRVFFMQNGQVQEEVYTNKHYHMIDVPPTNAFQAVTADEVDLCMVNEQFSTTAPDQTRVTNVKKWLVNDMVVYEVVIVHTILTFNEHASSSRRFVVSIGGTLVSLSKHDAMVKNIMTQKQILDKLVAK